MWRIAPTAKRGDVLRPAGGLRDDAPVTAIATGTGAPAVYIGHRSGRVDTLAVT
ncbi:hypothetical protein AB0H34_44745 [Saccharopolyspora shandongensis]|uniref:hypothetical protein n=1 Tax=Saccharopolyspora shandongensis TaxID=418495 RepID=UPI0033FB73FC